MKTIRLLPVLVLSLLFVVSACKKDDENVKPDPGTSDSTLTVALNGVKVTNNYSVQFESEHLVNLKSNYTGEVITILKDGEFFSNKTLLDTTFKFDKPSMTFTFLNASGKLFPPKIGIYVKEEIILPKISSFTASSYTIVRGDSVTLTLVSDGDTNIITSAPITTLKSMSTDSIRHLKDRPMVSTKYTALTWNKFGTDTASFVVVVTDPPVPTLADSLIGSWLEIDLLYREPGSTHFNSVIADCEKDNYWKFKADSVEVHQGAIWCSGNNELLFKNLWVVLSNGNQIQIGGAGGVKYTRLKLTITDLIFFREEIGGGAYQLIFRRL